MLPGFIWLSTGSSAGLLCTSTSYSEDPETKPGGRVFRQVSCDIRQYFEVNTGIFPQIGPQPLSSPALPSYHPEWLLKASSIHHTHVTNSVPIEWLSDCKFVTRTFLHSAGSLRGHNCSHLYISKHQTAHSVCVLFTTYTGNVIDGPRDEDTRTMSPLGGQGGWNPHQQFRRVSDFEVTATTRAVCWHRGLRRWAGLLVTMPQGTRVGHDRKLLSDFFFQLLNVWFLRKYNTVFLLYQEVILHAQSVLRESINQDTRWVSSRSAAQDILRSYGKWGRFLCCLHTRWQHNPPQHM
jgi:hypothetical protein